MTIINFLYLRIKLISIGFLYESDANIRYIFSTPKVFNENILYIKYVLQHIFSYYSLN